MARHYFQTSKIVIAFESVKFSLKPLDFINYVSGSKVVDILDPFAPFSLEIKLTP